MKTTIEEIFPDQLAEYAKIPIAFEIRSIFEVGLVDGGLGGIDMHEVAVQP